MINREVVGIAKSGFNENFNKRVETRLFYEILDNLTSLFTAP